MLLSAIQNGITSTLRSLDDKRQPPAIDAHTRIESGGWTRQVTVRELDATRTGYRALKTDTQFVAALREEKSLVLPT
jgi:hypothetical protein